MGGGFREQLTRSKASEIGWEAAARLNLYNEYASIARLIG